MAVGEQAAVAEPEKVATKHHKLFAFLAAPFSTGETGEVRTRKGMRYVTAQTVMNRLDDVLGPENWWDEYTVVGNGIVCRLTIKIPATGQEITKSGAGGCEAMDDASDVLKSGFSDALKVAAVKFGIARYLYRSGLPRFAMYMHDEVDCFPAEQVEPTEEEYAEQERKEREALGMRRRPREPQEQSRSENRESTNRGREASPGRNGGYPPRGSGDRTGYGNQNRGGSGRGRSGSYGPPKTGKELAGWSSKQEGIHGDAFKEARDSLLKREGLPWKMLDLKDEDAVWVYEQLNAEFNDN